MRKTWLIVLSSILCALMQPLSAQDAISPDSISLDTLISDSTSNPNPEWYVAPDSLEALATARSPRRAKAGASCVKDSVLTFDVDSILIEVTCYEYGDTTRTTVWIVNSDGSRIGKSREESASSSTKSFTASYTWDNATNDWKGKEKFEYVYKVFSGQKKLISSTSFAWVNRAWAADKRYTYNYDAAVREIEYFEYRRNTTTNELNPYKGRIQTWIDDTMRSLEELYTTYSNGAWNAGTKKEWAYDTEGRQAMYAYYGTITNDNWIGSSKETWTYGGPSGELTYYEKFGWYNNDWSMTKREIAAFDAEGRQTLVENYTGANGIETGVKKEEYTFDSNGIKTMTVAYAWSGGAWVGSTKETWEYNGPNGVTTKYEKQVWSNGAWVGSFLETWTFGGPSSQLTLHEQFEWANTDWSRTLKEETEFDAAGHTVRIENYTYANGATTGTKKETTTYTSGNKTEFVTFAWVNGVWANATKETWNFTNGKQTLHEQFIGEGNNWTKTLREENEYSGANLIRIENYTYANGVTTGTQKETYTYSNGKKTEAIIYAWENGDWVDSNKEIWEFNDPSGKQTKHEKSEWNGNDWTIMVQENTAYSGSNVTSIENYERLEGVWTGTQKEEYAYTSGKKTSSIVYAWVNETWIEYTKEVWGFTSGKQIKYETYAWNGNWVMTLQENTVYEGNNITQIENYALLEGVWTGTKKEEYTYDGGAKTQTIISAWVGGAWVYSTKNEIGYQDGDTQVSEANYTWKNDAWAGTGTRTFTTYDNGKVTVLLTKDWPDGAAEWTNKTRTLNTYNAEGENIMTHNANWNGEKWVMSSMTRSESIIDAKGRVLLNASWKCTSDSLWKGVQKDTAAYSVTDKPIFIAQYKNWKNNNWVPVYEIIYKYDEADRDTLSQRMDYKSNKWQGVFRYEHRYDDLGRETASASYTSWNTSTRNWVGSSKQEVTYYGNTEQYATKMTYRWKSNAWTPLFLYSYTYDASGREIKQVVQSYANGWINASKYIKEYNGSTLLKSNAYVWLDDQWIIASRNESYYDNDAQAKLRREITGSWNDGVVESFSDQHYVYSCDPCIIRFVNYDGTELESQTMDKGQMPSYTGAITPTKPEDVEYTYEFSGWTPKIVEVNGSATYTATYTPIKKSYTITWLNDDNSLIEETTVEYGKMPTPPTATKPATAEFTYTFNGWTPGIGVVTGDATYTATYKETKNSYTITWLNDDNSLLEETTVEYGKVPEHAAPTKENTAEWTYTFNGWDPTPVEVTGVATYKATFKASKNSYTITWKDEEGKEIGSDVLAYGETPKHEDLTKENTAEWTYTFQGWTPSIIDVVGDAEYTAVFDQERNKYTIKFVNYDGSELQSSEVTYGELPKYEGGTPTKPADAQDTYTFIGWDKDIAEVDGDATYTATYRSDVNSYTITWLNDDNSLLEETTVEYGKVPEHAAPTKENTAEWTYTFKGWDPTPVEVTENTTYKAQFTATKKEYTITWKNEDGSVMASETLAYGKTPSHVAPTKENTAEWTYTFKGWTPDIVDVVGDAEYTAVFNATKNKYTIKFVNYDGSELQSSEVAYGELPKYEGGTPTKPVDAQNTYTFDGWDKDIVEVDGDATYTATYRSDVNSYTITWLNDDNSLLEETTVEYGKIPTHAAPTKENTAEWTYTFNGWDPTPVEVTENTTYKAQFTATKKEYTITWKNEDGSVIESETLEYGKTPSHAAPTKENTAEWTYTFKGWTPDIIDVVGDAEYTAVFNATKNKYTIKFVNYDGSELQSSEVTYGELPKYEGGTPTKPADAQDTYTFIGWDKDIAEVDGDATYTATYRSDVNSYTITWLNDDNTLLEETTVEYGKIPTHADATKQATAEHIYTFSGWTPAIEPVTGAATYKATFTEQTRLYTITWLNEDGSELSRETLEYGATPKHADLSMDNTAEYTYRFTGWTPAITTVTADASYKATFETTRNKYTVTFLNEDGTELQSSKVEYGVKPTCAEPTKQGTEEFTYTFAGWSPAVVAVTEDATYKATFSATKNKFTITWLNDDKSQIDQTTVEYGATPAHADIYKESTDKWTYTFAGWEPKIVATTGDATYTAVFDSTENIILYHITVTADDAAHGEAGFIYADSSATKLLTDSNVPSGAWIELQASAADNWHFVQWSDGDTASVRQVEVTSDMQYVASFEPNCGDYPTLPVVSLYDWLLMLDVRSIHAMGYTFAEEDVAWYRVHGEPDKLNAGASADDERLGTGYSFTLDESFANTGDYYAMVDVSGSPVGVPCTDMMRSQIIHFASTRANATPMLAPVMVRPNEPQQVHRLNPDAPTTIMIYDISGQLLRTISEEGVDRMDLQAESVAGCYQLVIQNGDLRTVLRYIVVQ